tara:strand:+ start:1102 stop:1449 length:348 start_codon:yes stop_codon:yes gene_type:complete
MKITKKTDGKRVISEQDYYEYFQKENPSWLDVLEKINAECGCFDKPKMWKLFKVVRYNFHVYDIKVSVVINTPSIQTTMTRKTSKIDWVENINFDDLMLPYFEHYLQNLREVWTS